MAQCAWCCDEEGEQNIYEENRRIYPGRSCGSRIGVHFPQNEGLQEIQGVPQKGEPGSVKDREEKAGRKSRKEKQEEQMIYIGNHVSISKGFLAMGKAEEKLGGNTFAFFTRNPRGGRSTQPDREDIAALREFLSTHMFGKLVAHAPYTMNLCSAKEDIREFSENVFREDLQKMELLPGQFFNFHPGSHLKQGYEKAADQIADVLNRTLTAGQTTTVLLETMSGKGTEVGRTFEELRGILDRAEHREKLGVCLDTCHVWDGGYDIVNDLDGVLQHFDEVIGLDRLFAVHLNDSKNDCGSHKDRHEKIGLGKIGEEALMRVVNHPLLQNRPFILETPNEDEGYRREIALVKSINIHV